MISQNLIINKFKPNYIYYIFLNIIKVIFVFFIYIIKNILSKKESLKSILWNI
jgi:hypothetical protein